jgi:hypothetical protein
MNGKRTCDKIILCMDCHRVLGLLPKGGGGIQSNLNHHNDGYMFCRYRHHSAGCITIGKGTERISDYKMGGFMVDGFWGEHHKKMGWKS